MAKIRVAMYGLTTENYKLAAELAESAQVTIVDETLQMATDLDAHFLRKNPSLQNLMGEDALMSFKPLEQVLGGAQVIFFAPKLRRPSDEVLVEAGTKMRDLCRYISKGVTLVNSLPTGPGGNSENIMLVEKQTGLKVGSSLAYAYMPLKPREPKPAVVSTAGAQEDGPLKSLGFGETSQNIFSAELEYARMVLGPAVSSITEIELARRAREARVLLHKSAEIFIDELAKYLYDLKAIQASDETGESVSYLAGAALKSFDNYVRYVVDETREVLKDKGLKASRTKIVLLWTLDAYEARGERLQVAESIQQRLKDYVTDVETVSAQRFRGGSEALDPLKHNVVIVCSKEDQETMKHGMRSLRSSEATVLLATPGLKRE